ncbi:MAG: DNA primase [Candidatus Margulisbacteria bacterium]|nr:DNA primase [Candidatus Margulisiibacteriota bacterium]
MIPKSTIEDIKDKADLVGVIGEYVSLKKRGKNYLGLCPFHGEKTPSFTVSPEKKLWHCFGCGEGGNIFDFIMKSEQMEFADAVRFLGDRVGVFVEEAKGGTGGGLKKRLFEILEHACKFYQQNLDEEIGRRFLEQRKINNAVPGEFRLGVTKPGWDNLLKFLVAMGFAPEDIEKAGLVVPREKKNDYFDRFRNRFMFPVMDQHGRVLGFSGRTLSSDEPKYLNSPDNPVFNKGSQLFGYFNAREEIKKLRYAVMVEGNIDLLSCWQAGIKNVVAPLGTAFTEGQARLLSRVAEAAVIAFDSDKAGVVASERAAGVLRSCGLHVRIAQTEGFKDPDEYISSKGKDAFLDIIKRSMPALEFTLKRIIKKYNISSREGRVMAAHEVADALAKEKDLIMQKEYAKAAAQWLSVDEAGLAQEIKSKSGRRTPVRRRFFSREVEKPRSKVEEAEMCLLTLALQGEEALSLIRKKIEGNMLDGGGLRAVLRKAIEGGADILEDLDDGQKRAVRALMMAPSPIDDLHATIDDCIGTLKAFQIKNEMHVLRSRMAEEEKGNNSKALVELQKEYHKLSEILRSSSR